VKKKSLQQVTCMDVSSHNCRAVLAPQW